MAWRCSQFSTNSRLCKKTHDEQFLIIDIRAYVLTVTGTSYKYEGYIQLWGRREAWVAVLEMSMKTTADCVNVISKLLHP